MKVFLFDVDATLVLTGGAGLRALDRAFQKRYSLDGAMTGIAPHGKTDPAIIREIFHARFQSQPNSEREVAAILEDYVEFLRDEVERSDSYHVLPGIPEILAELSNRNGVMLGLATGNVESGARIKLQPGGLNRFFSFGGFGSDSESRPALVRRAIDRASEKHGSTIPPRDVLVIGDTPLDIAAGRELGCVTVGVATGKYSEEQLRTSGADLAIPDCRDGRLLLDSILL